MKKCQKINVDSSLDLIIRAQKGDIYARNLIIENSIPLIKKIAAKTIQTSTIPTCDLIQEGILGLVVAIEKFKPEMGSKFTTYAGWWIRQAMFKAISEQSYAYNIPVYIQETMSRFNKTKQQMEKTKQNTVTNKEVAKQLNISEEKINVFLGVFAKTLSLESGINLTENNELSLSEVIEDEKQNVERSVISNELKQDIKIALDNLKEREKNVIVLRFGLENNQKQTLEQIGESYGVTKECVRQIEKRALNKIAANEFIRSNLISYIR